jgi:hypothetical protein
MKNISFKTLTVLLTLFISNNLLNAQSGNQSVGLQLGSQGIGAFYEYGITDRLDLRGGASFFSFSNVGQSKSRDITVYTQTKIRIGGISLGVNYVPYEEFGWLKISGGLFAQWNSAQVGQYYILERDGETEYYGNLILTAKTFPVSPFASVLLGNFDTNKKLVFGVEIGTTFHGSPKISFTGDGRVEPTTEQQPLIQSNVKNYMFFPILNFKTAFKF